MKDADKQVKKKNGITKDTEGMEEEGPSVGQPFSSTAQTLFKHTDSGHVIMCWDKTRAQSCSPTSSSHGSVCPQTPFNRLFRQNNDE